MPRLVDRDETHILRNRLTHATRKRALQVRRNTRLPIIVKRPI
jgi:hypothetical protein